MKASIIIVVSLILTSCFDLVSTTYWEDGNYAVTDNAGDGTIKTLYYMSASSDGHGRVDYVDAIGHNDKYIIVRSSRNGKEYWVLNRKKDRFALNSDEIVEGPFTYQEFKARKKELRILNLRFSRYW